MQIEPKFEHRIVSTMCLAGASPGFGIVFRFYGRAVGKILDDPATRQGLFDAIRRGYGTAELVESRRRIHDPEFAEAAAKRLTGMMEREQERIERQTKNEA